MPISYAAHLEVVLRAVRRLPRWKEESSDIYRDPDRSNTNSWLEMEIVMAINAFDANSKNTVLDVVRTERAKFYKVIDDPANWNVQTRCTEWQVRDMVGHMIDVTEGYLPAWDKARNGEPPVNAHGTGVRAE